jgi:hypothetical protein
MKERAPRFSVLREGPAKVAGKPAHEIEFAAAVEKPRLRITQWHVLAVRDGWAYCFVATAPESKWAKLRPHFEAFIAGFR